MRRWGRRVAWASLAFASGLVVGLGLCRREAGAVERAARAIEARGGVLETRRVGLGPLGYPRAVRVILGPQTPGYDPSRPTTAADLDALAPTLAGLGGLAEVDLRLATVGEAEVRDLRRRLPGVEVRR